MTERERPGLGCGTRYAGEPIDVFYYTVTVNFKLQ